LTGIKKLDISQRNKDVFQQIDCRLSLFNHVARMVTPTDLDEFTQDLGISKGLAKTGETANCPGTKLPRKPPSAEFVSSNRFVESPDQTKARL